MQRVIGVIACSLVLGLGGCLAVEDLGTVALDSPDAGSVDQGSDVEDGVDVPADGSDDVPGADDVTLVILFGGVGAGLLRDDALSIAERINTTLKLPRGATVELVAEPDAGTVLAAWGSDCANAAGMKCRLQMDSNRTVTATWAQRTWRLAVAMAGDGTGAGADVAGPRAVVTAEFSTETDRSWAANMTGWKDFTAMATIPGGDFVVAARSWDPRQVVLHRWDSTFGWVWRRNLRREVEVQSIAVHPNGDLAVAGYALAFDPERGQRRDLYVARIVGDTGETRWARTIDNPGDQELASVTWVGDDVVAAGVTDRALDLGTGTCAFGGDTDALLWRMSGIDGTTTDARCLGGAGPDVAVGVARHPDGEFAFAMLFTGAFDLGDGTRTATNPAGDVVLARMTPEFSPVWTRQYEKGSTRSRSCTLTSRPPYDAVLACSSPGNPWAASLWRVDDRGVDLPVLRYDGFADESELSVAVLLDGSVALAGTYLSDATVSLGGPTLPARGDTADFFAATWSIEGAPTDAMSFGAVGPVTGPFAAAHTTGWLVLGHTEGVTLFERTYLPGTIIVRLRP